MEIVLLERIDNLGDMGEVVSVKPGFARNYLLPQEKALRATKANLARFEAEREYLEKRNAETRAKAADDGKDLDGKTFVMIRKAGDTGHLYGSVSARDIVERIEHGVKRHMVVLEHAIKTLGLHEVKVRLHPEVTVDITMNVARSEDEAERQAKGEDVIASQIEAERAEAIEAIEERAEIAAEMFEEGSAPDEIIADAGAAADPVTAMLAEEAKEEAKNEEE